MKRYTVRALLVQTATFVFLASCVGCHDKQHDPVNSATGSVEQGRDPETGEVFFALDRSEPDDRDLKFDPDKPFWLALGRGSGWHGFETVEIDSNLNAELFRRTSTGWETCVVELTLDEWGAVLDSIVANDLYSLDRAYHADVTDGTQWKLAIAQGNESKTVYCNNFFPQALRRFAEDIDKVFDIDDALLEWETVPANLAGQHDDRLFNRFFWEFSGKQLPSGVHQTILLVPQGLDSSFSQPRKGSNDEFGRTIISRRDWCWPSPFSRRVATRISGPRVRQFS